MTAERPNILTIVVTTYNRASTVRKLLAHLENQTSSDFEVVVAIDGSTDGTADLLAVARTPFPLRWVDTRCKGYGLAVARNMGILAAHGGTVVILDDDSLPHPGFVAAHLAAQRPGVMTCGPRIPADPTKDRDLAMKMERLKSLSPLNPMSIGDILAANPGLSLVENNLSMSRSDWISLGLFSERLKLYGVIGQEFFARARHLGARWQFAPAAAIVHNSSLEGDNGLSRARKNRQIRVAQLLRPSLMRPDQYRLQIGWAAQKARNADTPPLRYPVQAWLWVPLRIVWRKLSEVRRQWAEK